MKSPDLVKKMGYTSTSGPSLNKVSETIRSTIDIGRELSGN
jgi:hypothetical protein